MISDPHESAAWRTFGMLDADEAAGFDEAMRHDFELKIAYQEMACLATAVAVSATHPIAPQAGQLERLHRRLGLHPIKRVNWLGITGWAAAATLTMVLLLERTVERRSNAAAQATIHSNTPSHSQKSVTAPPLRGVKVGEEQDLAGEVKGADDRTLAASPHDSGAKEISNVETTRLVQEIEVLREQLESVLVRDRKRFESIPGLAWPIIVRMTPPETTDETSDSLVAKQDDPTITAMLGDALTAVTQPPTLTDPLAARVALLPQHEVEPSAVPIYDAARDAGTLVVSNLPATAPDEAYNLWVTTQMSDKPVYVGKLPESNVRGGKSFDFSLGSKSAVPSGFILTKDRRGNPPLPSSNSTVLQGPR